MTDICLANKVEGCYYCENYRCCIDHCCKWGECDCGDCQFCGAEDIPNLLNYEEIQKVKIEIQRKPKEKKKEPIVQQKSNVQKKSENKLNSETIISDLKEVQISDKFDESILKQADAIFKENAFDFNFQQKKPNQEQEKQKEGKYENNRKIQLEQKMEVENPQIQSLSQKQEQIPQKQKENEKKIQNNNQVQEKSESKKKKKNTQKNKENNEQSQNQMGQELDLIGNEGKKEKELSYIDKEINKIQDNIGNMLLNMAGESDLKDLPELQNLKNLLPNLSSLNTKNKNPNKDQFLESIDALFLKTQQGIDNIDKVMQTVDSSLKGVSETTKKIDEFEDKMCTLNQAMGNKLLEANLIGPNADLGELVSQSLKNQKQETNQSEDKPQISDVNTCSDIILGNSPILVIIGEEVSPEMQSDYKSIWKSSINSKFYNKQTLLSEKFVNEEKKIFWEWVESEYEKIQKINMENQANYEFFEKQKDMGIEECETLNEKIDDFECLVLIGQKQNQKIVQEVSCKFISDGKDVIEIIGKPDLQQGYVQQLLGNSLDITEELCNQLENNFKKLFKNQL